MQNSLIFKKNATYNIRKESTQTEHVNNYVLPYLSDYVQLLGNLEHILLNSHLVENFD